jgi:hypothetical protein
MSEELELATLYSDDRLLDSLAGRSQVMDPDVVSGLLAAFAAEVDTYPVLLADAALVSVGSHSALVPKPSRSAETSVPAEEEEACEGMFALSIARRRRFQMLPRTAAAATAMVVVLGVGGAAAAVGGDVGPLQHLRRAVISVTDQVAPGHSREDRVANLLNDAHVALRNGDLRLASEKAGRARQQLTGLSGPMVDALQDELATVLARIQTASQRLALAAANAGVPGGSTIAGRHAPDDHTTARGGATAGSPTATKDSVVAAAVGEGASPSATPSHHGLGDRIEDTGVTSTADNLPKGVPGEPGIGDAKERLKNKAKEQLAGVPEEIPGPAGPIAPWRHPASEGLFDNPTYDRIIGGLGGDALKHTDPSKVAAGLTGGAVSPR